MENYVTQLIEDIESAMDHVPRPYIPSQGLDLRDVPTPEEEERTAQVRELEELTGISKDQLPPGEKLTDDQMSRLLEALNKMLHVFNWCFVLQDKVPQRVQYTTIRENFSQLAKVKYWDKHIITLTHQHLNMHYELSKAEKKIARRCIDKGLEAEFREGLEGFENILQEWRAGKFAGNREAYHNLYEAVHKKDKAISRRYDGLTGSRWLITIAGILRDGYISREDIRDFSYETKATIDRWMQV